MAVFRTQQTWYPTSQHHHSSYRLCRTVFELSLRPAKGPQTTVQSPHHCIKNSLYPNLDAATAKEQHTQLIVIQTEIKHEISSFLRTITNWNNSFLPPMAVQNLWKGKTTCLKLWFLHSASDSCSEIWKNIMIISLVWILMQALHWLLNRVISARPDEIANVLDTSCDRVIHG